MHEDNVDLVYPHQSGYRNAVLSDQFSEQTVIKIGKGGLKGIMLSADLVSEWTNAFPVTCTFGDRSAKLIITEITQGGNEVSTDIESYSCRCRQISSSHRRYKNIYYITINRQYFRQCFQPIAYFVIFYDLGFFPLNICC